MAALQQPLDVTLNGDGVPQTLTVRVPRTVSGYFADGTAFLDANTYTEVTPIAGALGIRLRGKCNAAGTLSFAYRRPPAGAGGNAATSYSASLEPPHANVSVLANTEFLVDIAPAGECYLAITWDPSASGAWDFLDILAV